MPFESFGRYGNEERMAPAFALPDGTGKTVRLWDYKQRKAAVIYFLGGSQVALLGQLRSAAPVYRQAGAELLVISAQTAARVTELTAELGLDYPLLADPEQTVHTRYIQMTYPQYNPQEVREKPLALFIADRFGAVNRYATTTDPNKLPSQAEILEVLEFLGNLCNP